MPATAFVRLRLGACSPARVCAGRFGAIVAAELLSRLRHAFARDVSALAAFGTANILCRHLSLLQVKTVAISITLSRFRNNRQDEQDVQDGVTAALSCSSCLSCLY